MPNQTPAQVPVPAANTAAPANPASSLPVGDPETFVAEFSHLDLAPIRDLTFMVSVSTGKRNDGLFLCKTVKGPYSFYEMAEEVGFMWSEWQHHAKVTILEKERNKRTRWLDEPTIDFIEANFMDIIATGILDGSFDDKEEFTHQAGIIEAAPDADFRHVPKPIEEVDEEQ